MPCRRVRARRTGGQVLRAVRCAAGPVNSGGGPDWLRVNAFVAAPGENVLQPSLVSSLFPHLPRRSQGTFRVGLALVAALLIVFCVLHWYVPMVAVATFAPLLLFVIYLTETGVIADLSWRVWALTVVFGIAVGVGWALLTASIVAESYSLGLGTEVPTATSGARCPGDPVRRTAGDAAADRAGSTDSSADPRVVVRLCHRRARGDGVRGDGDDGPTGSGDRRRHHPQRSVRHGPVDRGRVSEV